MTPATVPVFSPTPPAPDRPALDKAAIAADAADRLAALHAAGLSVADDDGHEATSGRIREELQR